MGSKTKTVTDLQIVNLLEPNVALKRAKKLALRSSRGKAIPYFYNIFQFKNIYRKSYNKRFLDLLGLVPSSSPTLKSPSISLIITYLQNSLGYTNAGIIESKFAYLDLYEKTEYAFTKHLNYDSNKNRIVIDGFDYYIISRFNIDYTTVELGLKGILSNSTVIKSYTSSLFSDVAVFIEYTADSEPFSRYEVQVPGSNDLYINGNLDSTKIIDWLKLTYGYTTVTLTSYTEALLTNEEKMLYSRYSTVGIDLTDNTITENSIVYTFDSYINTSDTQVDITFKNSSITRTLTYVYNDTLFDERVLFTSFTANNQTATKYHMLSSEDAIVGTLVTTTVIDFTAIIPMKENNVVNTSSNIKRMLKKLNLSPQDLIDTLDNPDLDNVYLTTLVSMDVNDNYHNKALFDIFSYLLFPDGIYIPIQTSQFNTDYRFTSSIVRKSGVVNGGDIKIYSRLDNVLTTTNEVCFTYTDEFGNTVSDTDSCYTYTVDTKQIIIQNQVDAISYDEVTITGFEQGYIINGSFFPFNNLSADKVGMVIPLQIYNKWTFKQWINIYENSLSLIGYSISTVKLKWYQTGLFAVILKILIVVIVILTTIFAPPAGATLATLATNAAIGFAISFGAQLIAKAIGGPLGAVIGAIAAIGALYATGLLSMPSIDNVSSWLPLADAGLSVANQIIALEIDKMSIDYKSYMDSLDSKFDDLKEKMKEFGDPVLGGFLLQGSYSDIIGYAESYASNFVGSIENTMSEYNLYDIHSKIEQRNNIANGTRI